MGDDDGRVTPQLDERLEAIEDSIAEARDLAAEILSRLAAGRGSFAASA